MIICLEGINGSGKSAVAKRLGGRGVDLSQLTSFGSAVRTAIMDLSDGPVDADVDALAFAAARLHGASRLNRTDDPKELVVLERWVGALEAYGRADGIDNGLVRSLTWHLEQKLTVAHTILLDLPGGSALDRIRADPTKNRFETRGAEYLDEVRKYYLEWAGRTGVAVVDAGQAIGDVVNAVARRIQT